MFLGIDIGTSGVKALLIDEAGEIIAQATSPLSVSRPQPLWSEQNPEDWFDASETAVLALKDQGGDLAAVKAIGLSGQMHGATLLDRSDKVLRPAILWNDGRSESECQQLEERVSESRRITGNLAMPGFTAPKLLWVKNNEPGIFEHVAKVLLPKDYLRLRLTGEYASDQSDSAGTLWLDVGARKWSSAMLDACSLNEDHMPRLHEGTEVSGHLRPEIAERWGMKSVPVAAGAGDNAAGAVGIGVTQPGDALISLGTSGVYFVSNAKYSPNPEQAVHAFCHCLPNTWHQMSVILSAASCLDWLVRLTGGQDVPSLLAELEANADSIDASRPLFLPYLTGERTPHNNAHAKGVFFGMTARTERWHLTQSVLEGVAFAFADGQHALSSAESAIGQVSAIGGGSRSGLWGQILADVLNRPLLFRHGGDLGPALGAARLAHLAYINESGGDATANISAVCPAPEIISEVTPKSESSAIYQERWQQYRALYQCSKELMPKFS